MATLSLYLVFAVGVLTLMAIGAGLVAWLVSRWQTFVDLYWNVRQWRCEGKPSWDDIQGFRKWKLKQKYPGEDIL